MRIFYLFCSIFVSVNAVIPKLLQARLDWPYTDSEIKNHLSNWKKITSKDPAEPEIKVFPDDALSRIPRYTAWNSLVSQRRDRKNVNRMLRMLRGY
ncbi:Oidioi.mRNA.OKI2018_I69.chr2.g4760.t1.cds [Oikopleura dioica]|uniref:Oidioi.mRNA.OKI2018_I69.chr2.g4760.t1.cds n=1 Tax=Oikopleura dioica TaxID=34765 RepID=A0ABN7T4U9_OIKDI|nr:Oidioi.mRNA.OKI2018_I69.chr2.g4760.t1.cds [Oikopleura dioica]